MFLLKNKISRTEIAKTDFKKYKKINIQKCNSYFLMKDQKTENNKKIKKKDWFVSKIYWIKTNHLDVEENSLNSYNN